jgi:hypothetical protein
MLQQPLMKRGCPLLHKRLWNLERGLPRGWSWGCCASGGSFTAGGSLLGGSLTSNGVPVVVSLVGNQYIGKAGALERVHLGCELRTGRIASNFWINWIMRMAAMPMT